MANFNDLTNLLEGFVEKGPSGCGCAVAKNGEIIYEGYFGLANVEENRSSVK